MLFEVAVATTLLTVAVVWMLRSFSQTIVMVEDARDRTRALALLEEQVLAAHILQGVAVNGAQGSTDDPAWQWAITVAPVPDATSSLALAQCSVSWMHGARQRTVTTATWLPVLAE